MTIEVESARCKIVVDSEIIEQFIKLNYLHTLVTSFEQPKKEVDVLVMKTDKSSLLFVRMFSYLTVNIPEGSQRHAFIRA